MRTKIISARLTHKVEDEIDEYRMKYKYVEIKGFGVDNHGITYCIIEYSNEEKANEV